MLGVSYPTSITTRPPGRRRRPRAAGDEPLTTRRSGLWSARRHRCWTRPAATARHPRRDIHGQLQPAVRRPRQRIPARERRQSPLIEPRARDRPAFAPARPCTRRRTTSRLARPTPTGSVTRPRTHPAELPDAPDSRPRLSPDPLCDGAQEQAKAAFMSAEPQECRSSTNLVRDRTVKSKIRSRARTTIREHSRHAFEIEPVHHLAGAA